MDERTSFRTCPLCEATCGLAITTRGREVTSVRGDDDDVFSHGYICPKGPAVAALDRDPDRLRKPMIRKGSTWTEVSWDDAFAEIDRQLPRIIRDRGRDAVAVYLGNPSAHNLALMLYPRALLRVLGSRNVYSASTVDQMPKQVSAGLMFGTALSVPVPDIDRTQYLLMLGADPLVSNGSLMTAPDVRGRLRAIKARGGRIVVIDPRRSRTAGEATEHHFIRPGTDAHFLMGVANVIVTENLAKLGRLAEHANGLDDVKALVRDWTPDKAARACGIAAETIRTIARDLATTERAAVYGRIGTCTQEFGTLASWLVDILNTLTGHLDQEGGAMFTKAAVGAVNTRGIPGRGKGVRFGRRTSRVSNTPEVFGELPVACLAEEIETPGDGQIRALITIAGNPALSNPNGGRLTKGLASLEFMVSCDIYLNETSRHAHVILPGLSPLEVPHYDVGLLQLAIRNVANYSPPLFAPPADRPAEWQTMLKLGAIVMGQGAGADPDAVDDFVARQQVDETIGANGSPIAGRDADEIMAALAPRRGPERLLDLMLRVGPYGDAFGARPDGLTLATLEANPHGVDLGALQPRIPEVLRTPTGKIELAPPAIVADVERLRATLERPAPSMVLIGRRDLRSNNSWMHNVENLVRGEARCTLLMHPDDATRLALDDGDTACVRSRVGVVLVPVEVTEGIMPGVVSIPHGWGHDAEGTRMRVARAHPGVNTNLLADEAQFDPLSGNAVLNGIPVTVERAA